MDLIVEIINVLQPENAAEAKGLSCGRCQSVDEIVVPLLRIPALNKTLAICGVCMQGVPKGYLMI